MQTHTHTHPEKMGDAFHSGHDDILLNLIIPSPLI